MTGGYFVTAGDLVEQLREIGRAVPMSDARVEL
jgi:hypothetical protein